MKRAFKDHVDAKASANLPNGLARQRARRCPWGDSQIAQVSQAAAEIHCQSVPERDGVRVGRADDVKRQERDGGRAARGFDARWLVASTQLVEILTQRAGRLVSIARALGQQRVDDAFQVSGVMGRQASDGQMGLTLDRCGECGPRLDVERAGAGRHLIQHRSKRKKIAPVIDRGVPRQLLRRHIVNRAGDCTDACQLVGGIGVPGTCWKVLRQPEVQKLHEAAGGEEDVAWRNISMNDPLVVRRPQRVGDLDGDRQDLADRQRPAKQSRLQARPIKQFHGDEGLRLVVADLQERADVRVVQRRGQGGLTFEASNGVDVFRQLVLDDLDGDGAGEAGILRFIHHSHTARPERSDDIEVRELSTNHLAPRRWIHCLALLD